MKNDKHYQNGRFSEPEKMSKMFDHSIRIEWAQPEKVIEKIISRPDMQIVDMGAGTGFFSLRFAQVLPEGKVYAVDSSLEMTQWIKERASEKGFNNIHFIHSEQSDSKLDQLNKKFDIVFLGFLFHHIDKDSRKDFLAHLVTNMNRGTKLVILDFDGNKTEEVKEFFKAMEKSQRDVMGKGDHHGHHDHDHLFLKPGDIINELSEAGFSMVESYTFLKGQVFLIFDLN
jgi:ubiquinone/menaquinone biosynthesis C-methylase UbiE